MVPRRGVHIPGELVKLVMWSGSLSTRLVSFSASHISTRGSCKSLLTLSGSNDGPVGFSFLAWLTTSEYQSFEWQLRSFNSTFVTVKSTDLVSPSGEFCSYACVLCKTFSLSNSLTSLQPLSWSSESFRYEQKTLSFNFPRVTITASILEVFLNLVS